MIVYDLEAINKDPRPSGAVKIKLPKQWLHWAQCARLKSTSTKSFRGYYMRGRGRNWRVNCFGYFEASCPIEHFDRWANSRGAEVRELPKTKAEFLDVVKRLHDASSTAR